jgi:two-component system LytT family response regulator
MNQNLIKVIIIDDEPEAIKYLEHQLLEFTNIQVVGTVIDSRLALAKIIRIAPQLVFLDIQMPHLNGFDVITLLKDSHLNPCIIFTTAFDRFAIRAIKAGAFDYLLKPVDMDELRFAIDNAQNHLQTQDLEHRIELLEQSVKSNHKIRFNTRSAYILLHPSEIFYIEADANYSEIHLSKTKREVVSMNIGAVQELLPKQFFRISRSVIINVDYLVKVSGTTRRCFLNKDGEEIEFTVAEIQLPELKRSIGE